MVIIQGSPFKYTANGMYGAVVLGFWHIALMFGSWDAMVVALFRHGFVRAHMYCTQEPDMRWVYRPGT